MKRQKRARPREHNKVIVENCINAFVDGGNSITAMWHDYLTPLVNSGQITEPYAKQKAREALDIIIPVYKYYSKKVEENLK